MYDSLAATFFLHLYSNYYLVPVKIESMHGIIIRLMIIN